MDGRRVACFRFEDFPHNVTFFFTKAEFAKIVRETSAGKPNTKRSFPDGPKKAIAVFFDSIPEEIRTEIQGIAHYYLACCLTCYKYFSISESMSENKQGNYCLQLQDE